MITYFSECWGWTWGCAFAWHQSCTLNYSAVERQHVEPGPVPKSGPPFCATFKTRTTFLCRHHQLFPTKYRGLTSPMLEWTRCDRRNNITLDVDLKAWRFWIWIRAASGVLRVASFSVAQVKLWASVLVPYLRSYVCVQTQDQIRSKKILYIRSVFDTLY